MMNLIEIAELDKLSLGELQDYNFKLILIAEELEKYLEWAKSYERITCENCPIIEPSPSYKKDCPMATQLREIDITILSTKLIEETILNKTQQALQLNCYLPKYTEYLKSKFCISIKQTI